MGKLGIRGCVCVSLFPTTASLDCFPFAATSLQLREQFRDLMPPMVATLAVSRICDHWAYLNTMARIPASAHQHISTFLNRKKPLRTSHFPETQTISTYGTLRNRLGQRRAWLGRRHSMPSITSAKRIRTATLSPCHASLTSIQVGTSSHIYCRLVSRQV